MLGRGLDDATEGDEVREEPLEARRGDDLQNPAGCVSRVPEGVPLATRLVDEVPVPPLPAVPEVERRLLALRDLCFCRMHPLTTRSIGRRPAVLVVAAATVALITGCGARAAATTTRPAATVAGRASAAPPALVRVRRRTVGHAVSGAPITAYVVGSLTARRRVLLVGCVHGNERQGAVITRRLRTQIPPTGTVWWVIDQANPDGCRAGRRQNRHGVDLNRNSPWHWRTLDPPGGAHYAGPRPLSEPESMAINRLVRRLHPTVSVWYHQHAALVDTSSGGQIARERAYAAASGLPLRAYGRVPREHHHMAGHALSDQHGIRGRTPRRPALRHRHRPPPPCHQIHLERLAVAQQGHRP